MKCADISTEAILQFLAKHQGEWCTWGEGYSMTTIRDAMPPGTPEKLQLAKMKILIKKGLVSGCDCGCRGDYEITDKGLFTIKAPHASEAEIEKNREAWHARAKASK